MFFNSFDYCFFLPAAAAIFWAIIYLRKNRNTANHAAIWFLIAASFYFYGCWNWYYCWLLLLPTFTNYIAGDRIYDSDNLAVKRRWLFLCLLINLGNLAFFKYCNFFIDNVKELTDLCGMNLPLHTLNIILPVGISFYTFHPLSYTIDIYRGHIKPTGDFAKFLLFVSFFPALVAGPIVRAADFLPQLHQDPKYDDTEAVHGLCQILSGLMKKIMIADILAATFVDPAFRNPETFSGIALLLAVYGYTLQIYCDFSAYSDIAIGSARIFGYKLPVNFNRPYLAASMTDFWRRWHISLSTWLRDYLYISLGGNRFGTFCTYRNLMLTMLLGGLWHGAAWNFVIWGGIHGAVLCVERFFGIGNKHTYIHTYIHTAGIVRVIQGLITFHIVVLCWVFFRSQPTETLTSAGVAWTVLSRIFTFADGTCPVSIWFLSVLFLGYAMHFTPPHWKTALQNKFAQANVFILAGLAIVLLMIYTFFNAGSSAFIYFQF